MNQIKETAIGIIVLLLSVGAGVTHTAYTSYIERPMLKKGVHKSVPVDSAMNQLRRTVTKIQQGEQGNTFHR